MAHEREGRQGPGGRGQGAGGRGPDLSEVQDCLCLLEDARALAAHHALQGAQRHVPPTAARSDRVTFSAAQGCHAMCL